MCMVLIHRVHGCGWVYVSFGQMYALASLHFVAIIEWMYYIQLIYMNVSIRCNYVVLWCLKVNLKITIKRG